MPVLSTLHFYGLVSIFINTLVISSSGTESMRFCLVKNNIFNVSFFGYIITFTEKVILAFHLYIQNNI